MTLVLKRRVFLAKKVVAPSGSLLLDPGVLTAGAGAAYSTRLLRTAYAGNCMLVRRSSDNTTLAIGFTGSPAVLNQSALTTFVGAGNGFIVTWYDQSGNGRDITQSTAGNQPQIVASGVVEFITGTIPGVLFIAASSTYLGNSSPFLYAAGAASVSMVEKIPTVSTVVQSIVTESNTANQNARYFFSNYAGAGGQVQASMYLRNDAGTNILNDASNPMGTPGPYDGTLHYALYTDTGSVATGYTDNTAASSPLSYTRSGTLTQNQFTFGAYVGSTISRYANGTIAEMIAFPSALGSTDRGTLYTNQSTFY